MPKTAKQFQGFPTGKHRLVPIPSVFFTEILPNVSDVNELKVLLHFFNILNLQEGSVRFIRKRDLMMDETLLVGLSVESADKPSTLKAALDSATQNGYILEGHPSNDPAETIYFLNTARGRDAQSALRSGKWQPEADEAAVIIPTSMPDIFRLYEDNIGMITPMIADLLQEAEKNYPAEIIRYAFEEAVKQNARNWKYIEAILRNWYEKGSHGKNSRDSEKDRRKYIEGEYAEFINHE